MSHGNSYGQMVILVNCFQTVFISHSIFCWSNMCLRLLNYAHGTIELNVRMVTILKYIEKSRKKVLQMERKTLKTINSALWDDLHA